MELTPAMRQYQEMKKQNPDCILFFRIGDFYEVFFEDARICHDVLDLVLTSKNKNSEDSIPMAGIPHHSIDKYIPKLIHHGYKIAIAEQMTDPKPWKLVEREITQIITPWTYIQEWVKSFNYMLAITRKDLKNWEIYHVAWWDFTIGEYQTKSFFNLWDVQKRILTIAPTEIIIDIDFPEKDSISTPIQQYLQCLISVYEVPVDPENFLINVSKVQALSSFGQAAGEGRLEAVSLLLNYIKHTQQQNLANISKISYHAQKWSVLMDEITVKNLEIFSSSYENNEQYSLFWILDQTKTSAWARLLRYYLANPINDLTEILRRQSLISHYQELDYSKYILKKLNETYDLQKLTSSILYKKLSPLPFLKLRATLKIFFENTEEANLLVSELKFLWLDSNHELDLNQIFQSLSKMFKSDEEAINSESFIADGWNVEIDRLREIAFHSDDLLLQYQQFLVQQSWVQNVKLKYVMNQWYFIELTIKDSIAFEEKLWIWKWEKEDEKLNLYRRQTLKWNQRYSSDYLEKLQANILTARDQLVKLETQQLKLMWENIAQHNSIISEFAQKVAELDVFCSHAVFAYEKQYAQPEMSQRNLIEIVWWRHPVIEAYLPKDQQFIPNDLLLWENSDTSEREMIHIITWPNMWWKSTYLRQSALIVLLAHCGLYVPAISARIWLVDGIFARVGSGDVIAKNQSTFMTEMIEVSNILNNATNNSFIIFDELWRGTSTYDGLALTSAILQYVLKCVKAKTLIATHYHELIKLESLYPEVKNYSVSVYETDKEVLFMKKIVKGWANKSYGIDVAKIAWIPDEVLCHAREILKWFENQHQSNNKVQVISTPLFEIDDKTSEYQEKYEEIQKILTATDLNSMTPLQALEFLDQLKKQFNKD